MRCLLFGSGGQLGKRIKNFAPKDIQLTALTRNDVDLADSRAIKQLISDHRPDAVINAAAYTAVDVAETDQSVAHQVNTIAAGVMAEACNNIDALMVHYSTDYVFDGNASVPYTEQAQTNPLGVYGRTKLAGEQAVIQGNSRHLIFRTSWVYDASGKNFLTTMLRLAADRDEISVVNDQFGSPTTTQALAQASFSVLKKVVADSDFPMGIYHMSCDGLTSWYQFAQEIFDQTETEINLIGIPTTDYPTPAQRPKYSALDNSKLEASFGVRLPKWDIALQQCLKEAKLEAG